MNKEAHLRIGMVIGGIAGLLAAIVVSNCISYFPYSLKGIDWGEVATAGAAIGGIIGIIIGIAFTIEDAKKEGLRGVKGIILCIFGGYFSRALGALVGLIIGAIVGLIIAAIAPVVLGFTLGVVAGALTCIVAGHSFEGDNVFEIIPEFFSSSYGITGVIIGAIIGVIGWGLESEFIVNIIFIPIFALAGYEIGEPIRKIMAKKEEHEQKINEYKTKLERWEREGYEVSEFRERWFQ